MLNYMIARAVWKKLNEKLKGHITEQCFKIKSMRGHLAFPHISTTALQCLSAVWCVTVSNAE